MIPYSEWEKLCASDPAKANAIGAERMGWRRHPVVGSICPHCGRPIEVKEEAPK